MLPWVLKDKDKVDEVILKWIGEVNNSIVEPMTVGLKQIMSDLGIVNEAELFCSHLEFKDSDDSITKRYVHSGSQNVKDVRKKCNDMINDLIKHFKVGKLNDITEKVCEKEKVLQDEANKIVAYTVYFATYFHPRHQQCKVLLA